MAVRADGRISQPSLPAEDLPLLLTVEEAADLLRIGRTKAYAMTRQWRETGGRMGLPVVDFGHVLRVPLRALEGLIGVDLGTHPAAIAAHNTPGGAEVQTEPAVTSEPPPVPAPITGQNPPLGRRARDTGSSDQLNLFGPSA